VTPTFFKFIGPSKDGQRHGRGSYLFLLNRIATDLNNYLPNLVKFIIIIINTQVLAWVIAAICILGGGFMVLGICLTFGNDITYQWMVSEIFSLFTSILVVYPLYVSVS
jgi:hypothetical protein